MFSRLQAGALRGTALEKATIGTVRLRLFKIAARVKVSVRRIRFELRGSCPSEAVFAAVWKNLQAWPSQVWNHCAEILLKDVGKQVAMPRCVRKKSKKCKIVPGMPCHRSENRFN